MMTITELLTKAKKKRISIEFNYMLSTPDDCVSVRLRRDHLYIDITLNTENGRFINLLNRNIDEFAARCGYLERSRDENGRC